MEYNIYCDESCHLISNDSDYMVIGALSCPKNKVKKINNYLRHLISNYSLSDNIELKWHKVSEKTEKLYLDIITYFFSQDDLKFRAIIINKKTIDNNKFSQTDDDFYYKMFFTMLRYMIIPTNSYNIYPDIKDTNSYYKHQILLNYLRNDFFDYNKKTIKKNQPIRSYESLLLQVTDIIIGALSYYYRDLNTNQSKINIIEKIKNNYNESLDVSTTYNYSKFNLLLWRSKDDINKI